MAAEPVCTHVLTASASRLRRVAIRAATSARVKMQDQYRTKRPGAEQVRQPEGAGAEQGGGG
jgi:hypothetical protein